MSRFPNTRMAFARLFANLSICALPATEKACIGVGFGYADLLLSRAHTISKKGQYWRVEDDECKAHQQQGEGE